MKNDKYFPCLDSEGDDGRENRERIVQDVEQ